MSAPPVLRPGTAADGRPVTLGVMGGGQLGRMFVHAAQRMGYATAVLDPDAASPAGLVSHQHLHTAYEDADALAQMADRCAAITTEFENVPADAMQALAQRRPVAPSAAALRIAQDRIREKAHFVACGIPCAPHAVIDAEAAIDVLPPGLLPGILKTARLGYDGKGQVRVADTAALRAAWRQLGGVPCVLEQALALESECSVVVARGWDGASVHFAPTRNRHRDGILAVSESWPGAVPPALADEAVQSALSIARGLDYVGVLCVEFFVVGGRLLANEIAPRPHNSGHHTIDACDQSQFELQVRTLAGLPLVPPRQHSAAILFNLLGDLWLAAPGGTPDWTRVLALPGTHLHLYGKHEARAGRKMGHLTLTGADVAELRARAAAAAARLGLPPY